MNQPVIRNSKNSALVSQLLVDYLQTINTT